MTGQEKGELLIQVTAWTGLTVHLFTQYISIQNAKVVSWNPIHGEVYSIQHYVIKFVSDLQQVVGFLRVFQFPPPKKLTTTI
jgi:hypothetical protein